MYDHVWTMCGPYMDHVWTTYGPCMDHTWSIHGPYTIMYGYGPRPLKIIGKPLVLK